MRLTLFYSLAGVLLLALAAGIAAAQEGHPLVGSWHGTMGEGSGIRDLTVVMDWDGIVVTGLVNPGFEHAELRNARLLSSDWTVSFELDFRIGDGPTEHCVVNGAIDRLGSDRRTVSGTWTCAGDAQPFEIIRDRDY